MYKHFLLTWSVVCISYLHSQAQHTLEQPQSAVSIPGKPAIFAHHSNENLFDLPARGSIHKGGGAHPLYTGNVKKHRLNGAWKSWYPNGKKMDQGFFRDGIPDGEWKHWDSTGQLLAIRHYSADKLQRVKNEMRLNHPRNSFYALTYLNKNNSAQAASVLQSTYSFPQGKRTVISRSLDEWVKESYESYLPPFTQCLHHGVFINFYDNGHTRDSGSYNNGLKNGLWVYYSPSGERWLGKYKDGTRQQEWKKYGADGKIEMILFFDRKGKEQWRRSF